MFAQSQKIHLIYPKHSILPIHKIFAKLLELRANVTMFGTSMRETASRKGGQNENLDPLSVGGA
jgi:hypothetical protein